MSANSKQNMITAIAIIVALVAVVYAFMVQTQNKVTGQNAEEPATTEMTKGEAYEEGQQNPVVLTIEGREITRAEIMDNFAASGSKLPEGADMSQVFPLLQEQYLVTHLLNNAAHNAGVNGTNPEVAQRVEEAREQAIRAVYIENLTSEEVTEADVRKAYDEIIGGAEPIMERHARHILVETEEAAKDLISKLENGANFEELARDNSTGPSAQNGGDLGYFTKGEMVPAFTEAAFSMQVGEVSKEPVKTQFGYHIIKVEDEREREKPSFDMMKGQLEQQLRQAVIREKVQELRENANVTLYDFNGNPIAEPEESAAEDTVAEETEEAEAEETAEPQEEQPVEEEAPEADKE